MSKQPAAFYNKFFWFYPLANVFLKEHKQALFEQINKLPFGQLLDIGVGNGQHLPLYKTHAVTGIDTSLNMIKVAQKRCIKNVELIHMSGEAMAFADNTFDYVVLCHVIAVVNDAEALLAEAYRVLKPNGQLFILNHFTPGNWLQYVDHAMQFISGMFHFKSVFVINRLTNIQKFNLLKETSLGRYAYFKLLIYSKP